MSQDRLRSGLATAQCGAAATAPFVEFLVGDVLNGLVFRLCLCQTSTFSSLTPSFSANSFHIVGLDERGAMQPHGTTSDCRTTNYRTLTTSHFFYPMLLQMA